MICASTLRFCFDGSGSALGEAETGATMAREASRATDMPVTRRAEAVRGAGVRHMVTIGNTSHLRLGTFPGKVLARMSGGGSSTWRRGATSMVAD
ncbi:hypothetical protein GCM10011314_08400 [Knoellia flava]|uniref:Uncharacterized protein n=1 Tax=Knoellia flava TaxID=913969 RepID=A0A8H9FQW0_9MICO|nr:hypothetical protein GCM10011314_08400 [Knoellia flava]